jgi:glycerate 2-kinase
MNRALRRDALAMFRAALAASDPAEAVLRHVRRRGDTLIVDRRRYRLDAFRRIRVVGAGKAGAAMAAAIERILGARIEGGVVNVKSGHVAKLRRIKLNESAHPVPDEAGLRGTREIADIACGAGPGDLLICLISGGASALLVLPPDGVSLGDKQRVTELLLECGAEIHEMNTVRKHLSLIKGGRMARMAAPATVIALILSDVIGDDLEAIGSGPTAPDPTTFADAMAVIERYRLGGRIPLAVRGHLEAGLAGTIEETPKQVGGVQNVIVGSNALAIDAAAAESKKRGYRTLVLATTVEGETRDVARMHAAIAKEVALAGRPVRPPACILSGGETIVTLRGKGTGGRNQEFALAAALDIAGLKDVVVLSCGTDGTDGPTDAAGAIAGGDTVARALRQGLDARKSLGENDSYHFFEPLNDLIKTGPTGTNVMDVHVMLVRGR